MEVSVRGDCSLVVSFSQADVFSIIDEECMLGSLEDSIKSFVNDRQKYVDNMRQSAVRSIQLNFGSQIFEAFSEFLTVPMVKESLERRIEQRLSQITDQCSEFKDQLTNMAVISQEIE